MQTPFLAAHERGFPESGGTASNTSTSPHGPKQVSVALTFENPNASFAICCRCIAVYGLQSTYAQDRLKANTPLMSPPLR